MKPIYFAPFTKPIFATKWLRWIPIVEFDLYRNHSRVKHKIEIMFEDTKCLTWLWYKDGKFLLL